ncbi:voltage-dependent calcium channel subunit alpha-2/delta-3 [Gasterosteus aculeatus]|uniref:voltage-dependent calcium channel subunit alpha-2/delta-3-like isoform X1 n=1 Tax=Gasterosteus aculeatus aculeatus TaxID=481459 RepID=UPI001A98F5B6|nr:voltage-dependent calcium channel subunit alpha-2/delta-3-like isoform X1 [Gasterosteus aculeatus aculeatus]
MFGNWRILFWHMCSSSFPLLWILLGLNVVEVAGSQQGIPLSVVKLWASAFGGEMKSISAKYSGSQLLQKELWAITAPRPGTNSSSEARTPVKGSRGSNPKNAACPGAWEEGGVARGSPRKYGESFQTAYRKRLLGSNLGPPCSEKYKELEKSVRVEEIDGLKLVKNLAVKMEEVFRKKAEATRRLVEAAEEAHHQHEDNPDLQYEYFNAVLINEVDEEGNNVELGGEFLLEPNDHFNNLSVNLSLSVVQVPTNMYNKDPDIVNGVYWSEALNKVFVDNFERDPTLIWQYFGSAKGFFRQYPGVKWHPDEHGVIGFDCRNRKWYIQAATSPKDVIILVDVSGSMKGLRLTIARQTVSSILDTLGDDDFFNIIAYNQEIHYVEPCLNGTLVRADRTNKDHFREHLDKLFAKGIGLLGDALTEAFTILSEFNQTGHGSLCSQAIMLVTDGATEMYDDVFEKYNWPERKVRIFPYLIGRESAFADNLKWMACANKGYFSQISTLADVQENVMRYLHVMSRPKVIDHEHDTVWTEAYVDSALSQAHKLKDKAGPRLMTTVAMPVFSTKNETKNQGILLGVVGTDIPLQELMKLIPKHMLGIHGYAFAITNNGYILIHPDLRPLYQDGQKRRKPNYSSVDLSEVEWEDKDDNLRNSMVNRRTGTFSMEVKKTVDRGRRVLKMHNDYYYTDIKGTPFSVGVALSRGHGKYFFRGNVSVEAGLRDLEQPDVALADEWTYCNTEEQHEHRHLTQIQAIKLFMTGHRPHLKCDRELIQEVLFDAVVTAPLEAYWTGLALNKSENSDKGVEIAFLGTRTGLSRTNLFVPTDQLSNQDFVTAEDKEGVFNADHFPLWYKRAAEQVPGTFLYSIPFSTALENKSVVLASTAIQLLDDRKSPIVAAVGIQMKLEFFQRKFWTACRQCATLDGKCSISCDNADINCYLIDNNAFILVTEEQSQTGLFFGEVEGAVMNKLLQMGSFKRIALYDYQAVCRDYSGSSDSARTLSDPFTVVKWLLTELVIFLLEFNLYSWWNVDLSARAQRSRGRPPMVPCDTEYPAFVSERTIKETTGNIDCEGCIRSFVIQQIPSSNLFMVVVDNKCDCSSSPPVTMDPNEIMYNESLKCDRLKFQKDRKKPDSCHPFHPEENAMECGSATRLSSPLTAALLPLIAATISR